MPKGDIVGNFYKKSVLVIDGKNNVGNTKTTERGGGGESVVYELKQFYTF
jgi:hypothetical protein